jgi:hypothetical protein
MSPHRIGMAQPGVVLQAENDHLCAYTCARQAFGRDATRAAGVAAQYSLPSAAVNQGNDDDEGKGCRTRAL